MQGFVRCTGWCCLLIAAQGAYAGAPPAGTIKPLDPTQLRTLVRTLGSDKFADREQAAREIARLGIVSQAALEEGMRSADAEVRIRARSLLSAIVENDFQQRLEAFVSDFDGGNDQTLPAWEQFSALYGTSQLARQLFVEMQRAEPELFEALADSPAAASDAINRRVRQILDGQREPLAHLGTLASLLFVGAADGVRVADDGCLHIYPFVVQSTYHRNHKSPYWSGILKKLIGRWMVKDTTPAMINQNLTLAAQLELRDESIAISTRVLHDRDSLLATRQIAILMIGRFGDQQDLPLLEPLLADSTVCGSVQLGEPAQAAEMQLRDVALAAALHMSGQNLRDYGYNHVQGFTLTVYQLGTLAFENDAARQAALAKWAAWRAAHPAS